MKVVITETWIEVSRFSQILALEIVNYLNFRSKLQFESQKKTYSQSEFDFVNLTDNCLMTAMIT